MEMKRDLNFEIGDAEKLNKILAGLLMDVRRGEVDHETAKTITLVADKINKNNANQLDYKRITKHSRDISFFETKEKDS